MNAALVHALGRKVAAVLCILTLPLTMAACGDHNELPAVGTADSADVGDITNDDYFGNDEHMGDKVTISATVGEVLTTRALVLSGKDYGDESLLVLLPQARVVTEGEKLKVSGTVREFSYEQYRDKYDLDTPEPFDDFNDEEFLVADDLQPTLSPSATSSPRP